MLTPVFASFEVWTKEVYDEDRSGVGAAGPFTAPAYFRPRPSALLVVIRPSNLPGGEPASQLCEPRGAPLISALCEPRNRLLYGYNGFASDSNGKGKAPRPHRAVGQGRPPTSYVSLYREYTYGGLMSEREFRQILPLLCPSVS